MHAGLKCCLIGIARFPLHYNHCEEEKSSLLYERKEKQIKCIYFLNL